jgi:hypothetical protein
MKQLSFEEILDRMQHIDPNGEWVGSEYTKDVLEALVSTTLYWHQEQHADKYLEYLFDQASRLYGAYVPDPYFETLTKFDDHISKLIADYSSSNPELLPDITITVGDHKCVLYGCAAEYVGLQDMLRYVISQQ